MLQAPAGAVGGVESLLDDCRNKAMLIYTLRRVALSIAIIFTTLAILFSLIYLIPGDPATIALGPRATEEMRESFRVAMGLDQPIYIQLSRFVLSVLRGDMGTDVWSGRPVATIVFEMLPYTMILAFSGIAWAMLLAIPLGCYSAIHPGSVVDRILAILSVSAISIPSFVVALYSLLVFAVTLRWLPALGAGTESDPVSMIRHLILPAFSIGLAWLGYVARMVRASMLEVLDEPHIRSAHAFGLPERWIVYRYALRIAVLPTITLLGIGVGTLLSGALFAEIVFSRPGVGMLTYNAVLTRNYPVVMGCVLVTTAFYVLCTLLADLATAALDSRVRSSL